MSQILASNLLANNTVVFQADLNAGASLMRAAPVRLPKLGRARPCVPREEHALSPNRQPDPSYRIPTARTVKVAD